MKYTVPILLAALLGGPAPAQEAPMGAAAFEAYVTGRTLTYAEDGQIYGIEQYLPNRRVRWAFNGDECREGFWYDQGNQICFVYEHDPTPQCWSFFERSGGLAARFENNPEERELYEAQQSSEPMLCLGPKVGV